MEEKKTSSEAMHDLENLYNGVPDEFVDLTFKYLTKVQPNDVTENTKQTSRFQGSRCDEQSRRAEAEIQRERLARCRGSGKGLMVSLEGARDMPSSLEERVPRQRKGNPHSNICALCDLYIHIFRHRCLVCGRVYCKNCVVMGMGEMTEGRKCLDCLGRRFSQRYIERAGKSGCCCGYPSEVKRQELIWAEQGATISGEGKY